MGICRCTTSYTIRSFLVGTRCSLHTRLGSTYYIAQCMSHRHPLRTSGLERRRSGCYGMPRCTGSCRPHPSTCTPADHTPSHLLASSRPFRMDLSCSAGPKRSSGFDCRPVGHQCTVPRCSIALRTSLQRSSRIQRSSTQASCPTAYTRTRTSSHSTCTPSSGRIARLSHTGMG